MGFHQIPTQVLTYQELNILMKTSCFLYSWNIQFCFEARYHPTSLYMLDIISTMPECTGRKKRQGPSSSLLSLLGRDTDGCEVPGLAVVRCRHCSTGSTKVPASSVAEALIGLAEHDGDILPLCVDLSALCFAPLLPGVRTVGRVSGAPAGGALDGDVEDVSVLSLACTHAVSSTI